MPPEDGVSAAAPLSVHIAFGPVGEGDLPMLRDWLSQPHVRRWWGPPDDEIAAIRADLPPRSPGGSGFDMWIATADGTPFAYIQDGDPRGAREPYYRASPAGYRAVDLLIGPPSHIGRGLAAPMLRAFAAHAKDRGAAGLLLDPHPGNLPAVSAYARAGFIAIAHHDDPEDPAIVMALPFSGYGPPRHHPV